MRALLPWLGGCCVPTGTAPIHDVVPPTDLDIEARQPVARVDMPTGDREGAALLRAECDRVEPDPPPEDGCVTAVLGCGDVRLGHTAGGIDRNRFDTRFYERNFCTPATTNHDAGRERVYRLEVPDGDHRVTVTLDTPCADLDLAAFRGGPACPDGSSDTPQCEMSVRTRTNADEVELVGRKASTWWIVVEGKDDADRDGAAFALTVDCAAGL